MSTTVSATTATAKAATAAKPEPPGPTARDESRMKAWLERGKRERFTENVLVTPSLAVVMLRYNLGNRPLNQSQYRLHIDRLQRGDFILTHQGISFSREGTLNDGQHRLAAIRDSGISGQLQITFGCDRAEFHVIDQSKMRGAADTLSILGETNAALRASVAGVLLSLKMRASSAPDRQLVADYAVELKSADMDKALAWGQSMSKVTAPTAAAVAWYWIATHTKSPDKLAEFTAGITTGENLSGVRLRLREWLLREEVGPSGGTRDRTIMKIGVIINCWNAWLKGNRTATFSWNHMVKLPDVL